ncbi:MAG: arginine repressor [Pyrinomonadaceae bacterium]
MEKKTRQQKILSLIKAKRIGTQGDLTNYLERAGVAATQSSVSRDLLELGIVKRKGFYTLPQNSNGASASASGLLSLDAAGDCLIVAKCEAGLASAVAVKIDRANMALIVGTLAGEDAVFIAVTDRKAQRAAIQKLWKLFV